MLLRFKGIKAEKLKRLIYHTPSTKKNAIALEGKLVFVSFLCLILVQYFNLNIINCFVTINGALVFF